MLSNKNIINRNLLDKKVIILFFFVIYFIIGNVVVNDYGIPFDEDYQRIIAQNRLDYITNFFSNIKIFGLYFDNIFFALRQFGQLFLE